MAGGKFTSKSVPLGDKSFTGGLNTTSGPLDLGNSESSDLQNVDFDKFGSILKRSGYACLNTSALGGQIDGLFWFEYTSGGAFVRDAMAVSNGVLKKMDNLDGTWDTITGTGTYTATHLCQFASFLNNAYITNGYDIPSMWTGTGNALPIPCLRANSYTFLVTGVSTAPTVGATYTNNGVTYTVVTYDSGYIIATGSSAPEVSGTLHKTAGTGDTDIVFSAYVINANLSNAKHIAVFNNYLFLANVTVGGTYYPTRIYWFDLNTTNSLAATNWIEVSKNDGQEISGLKVFGDRLVVYKTRSIYNLFYTGDADIPFTLPGGGKSNSPVGCVAPLSIQEVDNGHVFLSSDGLWFYDGNNSYKLSDRLNTTFKTFNTVTYPNCVSLVQKVKNRYWLAIGTGSTNAVVVVWDYFNNAFSVYKGINACAMYTFYVNGYDERPYFGDYSGFVYRADYGADDYPANTQTAIDFYYYTNWKSFDDICDQKGVPHVYLYYLISPSTLTFSYSYDLQQADQYSQYVYLTGGGTTWGSFTWGVESWARGGGKPVRIDPTGRGRVVRFKFANAIIGESIRIDGLGQLAHLETEV